jgi:hypothetical protein
MARLFVGNSKLGFFKIKIKKTASKATAIDYYSIKLATFSANC